MFKENLLFELQNHRDELNDTLERINSNLSLYMKGSLFIKNNYYYVKYYENGMTISRYMGKDLSNEEVQKIKLQLKNYKSLEKRKKETVKELKEVEKLIVKYGGSL